MCWTRITWLSFYRLIFEQIGILRFVIFLLGSKAFIIFCCCTGIETSSCKVFVCDRCYTFMHRVMEMIHSHCIVQLSPDIATHTAITKRDIEFRNMRARNRYNKPYSQTRSECNITGKQVPDVIIIITFVFPSPLLLPWSRDLVIH